MTSEELFYKCIDRIDDDIKIAEEFLVGCIHEITIRHDKEIARDIIRSNLETLYVDKYRREFNLILGMSEDGLSSLIASSIDLSIIYKQVNLIYDKIELAVIDDVTANCHAHKAERAGKKLIAISKKMVKSTRKKREGLF